MHWLVLALALAWSALLQALRFASLHSWKESCSYIRLHPGFKSLWFHRCHHAIVECQTVTKLFSLMRKLAPSKRGLSVSTALIVLLSVVGSSEPKAHVWLLREMCQDLNQIWQNRTWKVVPNLPLMGPKEFWLFVEKNKTGNILGGNNRRVRVHLKWKMSF